MSTDPFRESGLAEHAAASADLASGDPLSAVTASFRRHERVQQAALAASGRELACKAGCTWCCHFKVDVRADEALALAEHVRTRLDAATRARVLAAAQRNAETIRTLAPAEHLRTNIACCFLVDGGCSVYAARPLACRNYHATDVRGCITLFEDPGNLEVPDSFIPELHARGAGHREGRQSAVLHAGLDVRAYDLTTAFLEAMGNPATPRRLRQGKRALIEAIVVD
jgi:Fe-S-cluster containining protein